MRVARAGIVDREIDRGVRRRRLAKRIASGAAAVLAAGALLAVGSDWLRPSIQRSRARFGHVERGDLEATLLASGTVVPAYERVLSCPVEARVERVLRKPGQVIRQGEEILELDTSTTRLRLGRLEEQLAQNHNDRLQRRLELEERISEIESRIDSQRLDAEIARFRLEQKNKLWADGLIAEEELKQAQVALKKAEIELRRQTEALVSERRLHEARLERLALDASILRKELDDARRQLELATTAAPVSGVLTSVVEEEGATVAQGQVLARIADLDSFRVEAKVSDAYAARLGAGQEVQVLIDEQRLAGRVASVSPTIEAGTIGFSVDLADASHDLLRQNLRVDVLVVTGRASDVLRAPRGPYIRGGGDRHQIFVVRADRALRTEVTLGLVGHEYYEVVDGLVEGDEIIISDVRDYLHARQVRLK
jgi:HlyD family secretion protein